MQLRSIRLVAALALVVSAACSDSTPTQVASPETAPTAARNALGSPLTTPVSGVVAGVSRFVGTFTLQSVSVDPITNQLVGTGTLAGNLTNVATGAVTAISQTITAPLQATGSCQILHLDLGPLDLTLLGLNVHLNRVVLDITAQSGPGNLLGNLLCAVANLLNPGGGALADLAGLINQIIGLLG